MSENLYDFAKTTKAIHGVFQKDYCLHLQWFPEYIDNFSQAVNNVSLDWQKCKFVSASKGLIPDSHGVYCFSILLENPLPSEIHVPLYIGKAAPGYLSERFNDYLKERKNPKGRTKLVIALNKYKNKIIFWWATLPRIYVDTIEEHLLGCYYPPCNTSIPNRERLWGKAF